VKFKSKSDSLFQILIYGSCAVIFYSVAREFIVNKEDSFVLGGGLFLLLIVGFLLWLLHGTHYELSEDHLKYHAAFLNGKIPIKDIREIVVGKTMWAGYKPATSRNGIIVKYNKYSQIYISPDSIETFVSKLKEFKPDIVVLDKK
jgi:hypothetical protein